MPPIQRNPGGQSVFTIQRPLGRLGGGVGLHEESVSTAKSALITTKRMFHWAGMAFMVIPERAVKQREYTHRTQATRAHKGAITVVESLPRGA